MPQTNNQLQAFRAVIFDLDGTLFESLTDLGESMNAVLTARGFPPHPLDAYRYFVGDGMEKLVTRALPPDARAIPAIVAACLADMKAEYGHRWNRQSKLYPGISSLLNRLSDMGITMNILSNKPEELTLAIRHFFLSEWSFAVVQGANAQYALKPDPAGAQAIAKTLDLAPGNILYLGDTAVDMLTANAAGMYPVGCLWGFREENELRTAGARLLLSRPMELLALWES